MGKITSIIILITMVATQVVSVQPSYAKALPAIHLNLPVLGSMLNASPAYVPSMIKGVTVDPNNPFTLDFIVDTGHDQLQSQDLEKESLKLIRYFLASLTVPDQDLWVNLSPYEKERVIPKSFGVTEMGRDLLAQDYLLKQLTASLMYPENELGSSFWTEIKNRVQAEYGTDV
ncbi:MAG: hypothetical protein ACI9E5_000960, partial [Candidatus Omnitrophota bacterium]